MFYLQKLVAIFTLSVCIGITNCELNVDTNPTKILVNNSKYSDDLCLTPECVHEASRILGNMNDRVDPCNNFYDFVCGNYTKSVAKRNPESMAYPLITSKLEVDSRLRNIIEDIDELKGFEFIANVKTSYINCMKDEWEDDTASRLKAVHNIIETVSAWRSLAKYESDQTLFDYSFVYSYLFKFDERLDATNSTNIVLELSIKDPPIPWGFLEKGTTNHVVKAYSSYMTDIIGRLGVDKLLAQPYLSRVLSFDIELSKIIYKENENYDVKRRYTRTTFGELKRKYPNLHLNEDSDEDDDTVVQIKMDVNIIESLEKWIFRKSKVALADWMTWRWTADKVDQLGPYFVHRLKKLEQAVFGYVKKETKWRTCVNKVHSDYPLILDLLYYGQYLSEDVVKDSAEIFANIKQQFAGFIKKADWLGTTTKQHALDKVKLIKTNFGIYEGFMVDETSDTSAIGWELSGGLLADNRIDVSQLLIQSFEQSERSNSTRKNVKNWSFVGTMTDYLQEPIYLSVGAMLYTDIFYNIARPKAINYGAFGALVGHELGHSLDDTNRHVNKHGNLNPWWDSRSNKTFVDRIKCLVQQYRNYGYDEVGLRLRSFSTRDEDIADNVGVKAAYFAYDKWAKKNNPEKQLPGLDYTPRQMFWIGFANTQCSKFHPQFSRASLYVDDHSPPELRINIPVSNIPEFARDFKCITGSKMNPVEKCVLW